MIKNLVKIFIFILIAILVVIVFYKPIKNTDDKFITAVPVDLNQIVSISKFRSCSGHDYSSKNIDGVEETNRSMKHYINPIDSLIGTTNVIKVFAPFDGTVASLVNDNQNNAQVGVQIWLTPNSNPAWSYIYYHITPLVKAGDNIKSGQLIGYANLDKSSVIDFDIALERWPQGSLKEVLKHQSNYLQLLHTGQLDSIFNHMNSEVLSQFLLKGVSKENIIVSKSERDASPCPEVLNNGHYDSNYTNNNDIILKK